MTLIFTDSSLSVCIRFSTFLLDIVIWIIYSLTILCLFRFRNELPDPSAKMKLLSLKRDPDRYGTLSYL